MKKEDYSPVMGPDPGYIDDLYKTFTADPESLDDSWQQFFQGFEFGLKTVDGGKVRVSGATDAHGNEYSEVELRKEFNVFRIIQSYRMRGHLLSDTNPIRKRKDRDAQISLEKYDLEESDLERSFLVGEFVGLGGRAKLKDILTFIQDSYCGHVGIEYWHIGNTQMRRWIRTKFEEGFASFIHTPEKRLQILHKLNEASVFEQFLQTKFVGQKRFSLEGGESTIPALEALIEKFGEMGGKEVAIGMAHRGRLNVLANILGKSYEFIFNEFEGQEREDKSAGSGDVKYHLGFSAVRQNSKGEDLYVKLMANPSHLETVGPVVQGYSRAQGDIENGRDYRSILPIVVHGDAAVAGQGVVYESVQMSKLDAYDVGGTIHFVINNQIGFTTDFTEARSSTYCTSIAKMIDVPILHVNGDDPDAVVWACEFAIEYRQKYQQDIFIDMVCYRKYGHNEGDEPKFTQPHLYGLIAHADSPREVYKKKLLEEGSMGQELAEKMEADFKKILADRFSNVKQKSLPEIKKGPHKEWLDLRWAHHEDFEESPDTGVEREVLEKILTGMTTVPEGFQLLKKAGRILRDRAKKWEEDNIDWGLAESLAFGSLLVEGNHIRFSGQDVIRGTFAHRHAKVFDENTNIPYCGLAHIQENQGSIQIYNSLLSEYAVLGFEYGYSWASPKSLVIWEAQFGDFANGAQILIDQYISSCEQKWRRMSGLVMLLPHGYEGQGPEHSSARPERFLTLAAEDNMIIANCTTPASFFHLIRRQMAWPFRKPLIHFSPKSLLRHPKCISHSEEFTEGSFKEFIDDDSADPNKVERVLFCWGKIYYELLERKESENHENVAIVRAEQLYPIARRQLSELFAKYKTAEFCWVQEEPKNMGAWTFLMRFKVFRIFRFIGRPASASPATGHMAQHLKEQKKIIDEAFDV